MSKAHTMIRPSSLVPTVPGEGHRVRVQVLGLATASKDSLTLKPSLTLRLTLALTLTLTLTVTLDPSPTLALSQGTRDLPFLLEVLLVILGLARRAV